jgi:acetate kinase
MPQVGCFDTAFHRGQPEIAQMFALPREMREQGVRRYGFHGLSYDYIASVLPTYDPGLATGRVIVAHLGNGASLCALKGGASVATTMVSPDGLPMWSRCGAPRPANVFYMPGG